MPQTLLFWLMTLLVVNSSFGQLHGSTVNQPTAKIDQLFARYNSGYSPGVIVAIIKDNTVVYQKSFGMANLEYAIPIRANTIFNVASLSKQFTAFAIALLADKGRLSLNDEVQKYIPELPDYGQKITILNLLTHTSGLKDQWDLLYLAGWKQEDVITNRNVLDLIVRQKELNFTPGERFQYCNSGYTLLALLIERVTGKSFASWMQENLFAPLQMRQSFYLVNYQQVIQNKAHSYKAAKNGFEESILNATTTGANGLHASLTDLCKWVNNYYINRVGSDSVFKRVNGIPTLEKLRGPFADSSASLTLNYGFGQGIKQYRGLTLIGHDGSDAGYRTYIGRFPQHRVAIILLGNFEAFEPEKAAMKIADIFLAKELSPVTKQDNITGKKLLIPEAIEQAISGHYQIDNNRWMRIFVVDRNIIGEIKSEKRRFDLIPSSNTVYKSTAEGISINFLEGKNGLPDSVEFTEKGKLTVLSKAVNIDLNHLKDYTGNFYCESLSARYTLTFQNNQLVAILPRNNPVVITQNEGDSFFGSYWWIRDLHFRRDGSNQIIGFEVNNGRAKKIYFTKID